MGWSAIEEVLASHTVYARRHACKVPVIAVRLVKTETF
jgi:hypothetical protein